MSKSELNKTLDTKIEKQQQNGNTFRRFPFRSQSLRLSKKSKSSSNNNKQSQQFNDSSDGNHPRKFLRQQTVNGRLSSTTSLNNLILSKLLLKDRDLIIISSSSNGDQNLSSSSTNETYNKQSTPSTTFFKRLSRHQSIKSIQQQQPQSQQKNRSNSISQNSSSSLNFLVGNFPPPPTPLSKTTTANHHYEDDEGVVTFEESEDDDDDEDYHPDDNDDGRSEIKYQIPGRYPRLVRLNRDCHQQQRLGIQIIGGCDFGIPVIIVGLRQNSPAQNCGKIFIGDQILSVNDVPINENNTHNDTLRLLAECGPIVSLLLKHTKSVMNFDRKWKHLQQNFDKILLSNNHDEKNTDDLDLEAITTIKHRQMSLTLKDDHHLNSSVENFDHNNDDDDNHRYRINLLASTISRFVSFSDRIRDSGFEIFSPTTTTTTSNNGSIIIECLNEDICRKWFSLIKNTIENLQENFIRNFNKHLPRNEHFLYMGYCSERRMIIESSSSSSIFSSKSSLFSNFLSPKSSTNHHQQYRWLSRFLIIKGGKIFLFKCPPIETLLNYKRKFENLSFQQREKQRKYRTNSNGSSLGSVGSTTTTTTTTSDQSNCSNNNNNNNNNKTKPPSNRLIKLNKCLENELDLMAIEQSWHCYQSDFRCQLKSIEPIDNSNNKQDSSFIITTNGLEAKYFSTECYRQLERLNNAWNLANYYSVLKNECKIYTVALEPLNIIGSFKIDWKMGFSFYDPKHNELIWSYQFYQLKHSSDDGQEILSLSFLIDSNDNHKNHHNVQIVQHVIRCSCLKTIIFSIHSFLRAKVFSLSM